LLVFLEGVIVNITPPWIRAPLGKRPIVLLHTGLVLVSQRWPGVRWAAVSEKKKVEKFSMPC
jgi:hypothetical protein